MNFKNLAISTAFVCFALALIYLLVPQILLGLWGVDYSAATGLVARRGGAVFCGVGLMFWRARHAPPSPARVALCEGLALGCVLLAALGLYELARGHVTILILSAVFVEAALAYGLLRVRNR